MPRNIKRYILTIALMLLTTTAVSAQSYLIYKIKGTVSEISGAKVSKVTQGSKLDSNTRLRINQNSEIWVVENNKRRTVFKLRTATGTKGKTVGELVADARKKTSTGIVSANERLISGVSTTKINKAQFGRAGVSRITTNDSGSETALAGLIGPDETTRGNIQYATVRKVDDGNHLYHFSITNTTADAMYANLIFKDSDPQDIAPLLPDCVLLPAGKEMDLTECQFYVPDMPFAGFILILCDEPFTAKDLTAELKAETRNADREYLYQIVR